MHINRKKKRLSDAGSATSDIAFILIIYFIVIAAFNINKGFLINLPSPDVTQLKLKDDILRYELNDTGAILYNDNEITLKQAETNIAVSIARHPNLALLLTISPDTPWQYVVSFVELAQKLHVDSFSFKIKENIVEDAS
jgi:biopolymer transport protein ExbD